MRLRDLKKLHSGDEVFWTDPDEGRCSRHYIIAEIEFVGGIVKLTGKDGSYLECYARELS